MSAVLAARMGDSVGSHGSHFWATALLVAALVVGAALAIALVVMTGGLAAPLLAGGVMAATAGGLLVGSAVVGGVALTAAAGSAGEKLGEGYDHDHAKSGAKNGGNGSGGDKKSGGGCSDIQKGYATVYIENQQSARITDDVDHMSSHMKEGSQTVIIGNQPASRQDDASACGGIVVTFAEHTYLGGPKTSSGEDDSLPHRIAKGLDKVADWGGKIALGLAGAAAGLAVAAGATALGLILGAGMAVGYGMSKAGGWLGSKGGGLIDSAFGYQDQRWAQFGGTAGAIGAGLLTGKVMEPMVGAVTASPAPAEPGELPPSPATTPTAGAPAPAPAAPPPAAPVASTAPTPQPPVTPVVTQLDGPVYRGTFDEPNKVFQDGFVPSGTHDDIGLHTGAVPNSQLPPGVVNHPGNFVSTTTSQYEAGVAGSQQSGLPVYVYEMTPPEAIDVHATFGPSYRWPLETEMAVRGGIPPEQIKGYYWDGEFHPNPNYRAPALPECPTCTVAEPAPLASELDAPPPTDDVTGAAEPAEPPAAWNQKGSKAKGGGAALNEATSAQAREVQRAIDSGELEIRLVPKDDNTAYGNFEPPADGEKPYINVQDLGDSPPARRTMSESLYHEAQHYRQWVEAGKPTGEAWNDFIHKNWWWMETDAECAGRGINRPVTPEMIAAVKEQHTSGYAGNEGFEPAPDGYMTSPDVKPTPTIEPSCPTCAGVTPALGDVPLKGGATELPEGVQWYSIKNLSNGIPKEQVLDHGGDNGATVDSLKSAIAKNGYDPKYPIYVGDDGAVVAGNHRYLAVQDLGYDRIPGKPLPTDVDELMKIYLPDEPASPPP